MTSDWHRRCYFASFNFVTASKICQNLIKINDTKLMT